ncbi:hypothetical protein [Kluyvera chengduensis]|uniref:hypothetical protein n=1 Tax=Kluyvera sp. 142359 TaxID=3375726 RepID=UPI003770CA73
MSEMIAVRQAISMPSKETVMRYIAEALGHITTLEPSLHLLPWSGDNNPDSQVLFAQCYDAGLRAANQTTLLAKSAIPQALIQAEAAWVQGIGLLCLAAGNMSGQEQPLTHNRLCDGVKKFAVDFPHWDDEPLSGFATVRSVALPVFRRLHRDGHTPHVILLQTLLHLVAWRSSSQYARQQAQRLLWLGGVLGEEGELNLMVLDKELREYPVEEERLPALLIFTDFLAHFPAGPVFVD